MDIQIIDNIISDDLVYRLGIYKSQNQGQEKSTIHQQCIQYQVYDDSILSYLNRKITNAYNCSILKFKTSCVNHLALLDFTTFQYINNWIYFDQIEGKPSTLTFIAAITDDVILSEVEFLKYGKFKLSPRSLIVFPSCVSFAFRINPIRTEYASLILGSVLYNKI